MHDITYEEIKPYIHTHERNLIRLIAEKHGWSISEVKRRLGREALKQYVETVISKAVGKPYREIPSIIRGELRIIALKLVMPIFWAVVRYKKDIPSLKDLLEATPKKVYEDIKKAYEELLSEAEVVE